MQENVLYLFSANTKGQDVLQKIYFLDHSKLFEEDDHSMCIRYADDCYCAFRICVCPSHGQDSGGYRRQGRSVLLPAKGLHARVLAARPMQKHLR